MKGCRHGRMGTWEDGDMGGWGHGRMGTWEDGDMGGWGHGRMGMCILCNLLSQFPYSCWKMTSKLTRTGWMK